MAERIRFLLDEHIDPDIGAALRRHGIDVTMVVELTLRGRTDMEILEFARAQQRVIVTDDRDFLRIAPGSAEHPGIVICPRERRTIGQIIRGLILVYEVLTAEEMRGRVEYL